MPEVEEKIFKEVIHFHYMTYMATPQHKNACTRNHEIYNFGRPFLGHHNYIHTLSVLCLGVENKTFKEIMQIHHMTYMATPLQKDPLPESHTISNFGKRFLVSFSYICYIPKLIKIG